MTFNQATPFDRASLLKKLEDILMLGLKKPMKTLFSEADDAFFDLAQHTDRSADQELYFAAMRAVRVQQPALLRSYFSLIQQKVAIPDEAEDDSSALSLVSHDELEAQVAIESMTNKAMQLYGELVEEFNQRVATLLETDGLLIQNPFSPRVLAGLFAEVAEDLNLNSNGQLVLFKLFDRLVLAEMQDIYQKMNSCLLDAGVPEKLTKQQRNPEPKREEPKPEPVKPMGKGAEALLEQLSKVLGAGKLQQIQKDMSALERGQSLELGDMTADVSSTETPAFSHHQDYLGDELIGEASSFAQQQENFLEQFNSVINDEEAQFNISELVASLFSFVIGDGQLADALKQQLARLQRPYVEVALADGRFFSEQSHPARKLLNQLSSDGLSWQPQGALEKDRFYKKLSSIVDEVVDDHLVNPDIFEQELERWQNFIEAEEKRAKLLEQRMLQVEEGKAKAEAARMKVQATLDQKLQGQRVPASILKLVRDPWANVLFLISLKEGIDSEAWDKALQTVDQLLWSVQPHEEMENREKLFQLMPSLLKDLRAGLTNAGMNPAQMSKVFAELEEIHMTTLRPDAAEKLAGTVADNDAVDTPQEHDQSSIAEDEHLVIEQLEEKFLLLVENLTMGTWVEMEVHGEPLRCKIAAFLKPTQKYIFVNRAGSKTGEYSKEDLAAALQQGQMKLLEDSKMFDRALEDVIGNLRSAR